MRPDALEVLSRIKSGTWLDQQHFPPLSWAVTGLIPEGFGLFTGPPKAGKSWAALGIVLAVAGGTEALGKVPTGGSPRPALYLALEDGDRRLQGRCRKLLNGAPIPAAMSYVTSAAPGEVFDLIGGWLDMHGHRRPLVVLDTLGKVMPPSFAGESAYQRDYRVGGQLKGLTDAHPGSALLVVHHTRKAGSEDWMDSTSGTNGLNGAADFTLSLSRTRNEDAGVLRVTGRDVPEGEYAITSRDGAWVLDGRSLEDAARAAEQARVTENLGGDSAAIVDFVGRNPEGVTSEAVSQALGLPPATVRQYLKRLHDSGRIERPSRGVYKPTVTTVTSVTSEGIGTPVMTLVTDVTPLSVGACDICGEAMRDLGDGASTHPGCES